MGKFILGTRLHDYGRASVDEMYRRVAADGYESVQLAFCKAIEGINQYSEITPEKVQEAIEAGKKHNIRVGVLGTYVQMGINDEEERKKNVATYISQLSVCKALGAACIGNETTEMHNQPAGTSRQRGQYLFTKSMDEILPVAEELGVTVGMEPVYYHSVNTPKAAYDVMQAIQSPNLKFIFDPGNLVSIENVNHQKQLWEDVYHYMGERIVAVHFKGMNFKYDGTGDFYSTSLEDSCIDYAGAFEMLKKLPQDIYVLREEAVPAKAASDIEFMKKYF